MTKFRVIIFHIFSVIELLTMSVVANSPVHYTAITDDFELYVQKFYQEESLTEINSGPPSTSFDPTTADPSLRLQICEEISRSGVFAYYGKSPLEMGEEVYHELQQPKYSDIFNHIYSPVESQNTIFNIPHKYDNPYKWLQFKVRGHPTNFYKNEYVFVCLLRRTNEENYVLDKSNDDLGYPSDEDNNSGDDSNGEPYSNFISVDTVSEENSNNSDSEDSDGADVVDEGERETDDDQDFTVNRNCNEEVAQSEKDSSRKNTISEDSNKADESDEEEFQWKTSSENSNVEETDDMENVDTGDDRTLSSNDEYLSGGTVGSGDVLRNEVDSNVDEDDIHSSSDEDNADSILGGINRFLEAIGGSDEDIAGIDIYGDSGGDEGSWGQSATSNDNDDDDDDDTRNGDDSNNIIPFYVSKIYNSHRGLGAHRFVFTKERRSRMMLAERPAKINSRPDFNIELHYLELRKRYEPVSTCEEDPVCKLKDSIQLLRLCALVLTSSFFKGKITYPIDGQQNAWFVREVSFRTEEGLAEAAGKSYREIMVRCYAETVRGRRITFFDISRAYRPNEVFVYISAKHDYKWYLENLSTNQAVGPSCQEIMKYYQYFQIIEIKVLHVDYCVAEFITTNKVSSPDGTTL